MHRLQTLPRRGEIRDTCNRLLMPIDADLIGELNQQHPVGLPVMRQKQLASNPEQPGTSLAKLQRQGIQAAPRHRERLGRDVLGPARVNPACREPDHVNISGLEDLHEQLPRLPHTRFMSQTPDMFHRRFPASHIKPTSAAFAEPNFQFSVFSSLFSVPTWPKESKTPRSSRRRREIGRAHV